MKSTETFEGIVIYILVLIHFHFLLLLLEILWGIILIFDEHNKKEEEKIKMFGVMAREKLEIPPVIAELDRSLLCNIYAYTFILSWFCIDTLK